MALYIARQPILDKASETIGYELLFREGTANIFPDVDGDHASSSVIDTAFFQIGLPKLTSGRKAFINFTPELITGDYWRLLPHDQVVIELLETVEPTEEIIDACRRIKQNGYKIALDDFVYREELEPLIKLADFVKLELNNGQTRGLVGQIRNVNPDIHFIAEKVENPLMFQQARKEGFSLFQGYHFSKPEMVVSKEPLESQAARIQLLHRVNRPDFEFADAEEIFKSDPTLTVKLLRLVNSAAFGLLREIHSIRQALTLIGQRELRRWATILVMAHMAQDRPPELMRQAALRGRFCELLAPEWKRSADPEEMFFVGIFSLLDAFTSTPLESLLRELPLSNEVRLTLLGKETTYSIILDTVNAFERADWEFLQKVANEFRISDQVMSECYLESIIWIDNLLK